MGSANKKAPPGDETGGATIHAIDDAGRKVSTDMLDSTVAVAKDTPAKALLNAKRWIHWSYDKKKRKVPIGRESWNESSAWKDYDDVADGKHSIGFVLGDGFGGIDLDACRDPGTGAIKQWAQRWIDAFGSYTEVSPSGTGVKIFAKGVPESLPSHVIDMDGESLKGKRPQVEAYVGGRWFAVTGQRLDDTHSEVRDAPEAWETLVGALKASSNGYGKARVYAGRNDALFRDGCRLRERGMDDDAIASALDEANRGDNTELHENFADGPLDERELAAIVKRVCAYPMGRPELAEMNEKHAFIHHWGAKPKVLSWRDDHALGRKTAVAQTPGDITARYDTRKVMSGGKSVGLGTYWLKHPLRLEYDTIGFAPEENVPGMFNMWRGFGVDPKPGSWSNIRAHLWNRVASEDKGSFDYILGWLAWAVQNPGEPAEVALVLRGGRGAGKGMVARVLMRIFGQHATHISNSNQVSGSFNAQHEDCALLFADEAVAPNNKKAREDLKRMITEPTLMIERKGIDAYPAKNRLKVLMASNDDWVVPAGVDERRFAVFDVASRRDGDAEYFARLSAEIQGDGPAAMLHDLRAMDLGGWHPRDNVPQTEALGRQKAASLSAVEAGVRDLLADGCASAHHGATINGDYLVIPTSALVRFIHERTGAKVNGNHLQPLIHRRLGFNKAKLRGANCYWLPALHEARARWDEAMSSEDWDGSDKWTVYDEESF